MFFIILLICVEVCSLPTTSPIRVSHGLWPSKEEDSCNNVELLTYIIQSLQLILTDLETEFCSSEVNLPKITKLAVAEP